tara:strand:- start:228 stop:626 length:399 start_codon:yes stop_codon:yes gene_type:complete
MNNEAGQIDGSVSITQNGELYIVSEIENVRILFSLEPVPSLGVFRINIEECSVPDLEERGCVLKSKEDAMEALCSLGVVLGLSELSLKAILGIIDEEWRTPQQVQDFINSQRKAYTASESEQEKIARMIANN